MHIVRNVPTVRSHHNEKALKIECKMNWLCDSIPETAEYLRWYMGIKRKRGSQNDVR